MYRVSLRNVSSGYRDMQVLHSIDLEAEEGRVTVVLGANGAGKSTLIRTLVGLITPSSGSIHFGATDTTTWPAHRKAGLAMALVPEGRGIFQKMTVRENLELGAWRRSGINEVRARIAAMFARFPVLAGRQMLTAGMLSGGEQQMLALARALMAEPRLLVLDEPSLGLAPQVTRRVFNMIGEINRGGVTVVLAEQNAVEAQRIADRVYVLELGRVVAEGTPEQIAGGDILVRSFLGGTEAS